MPSLKDIRLRIKSVKSTQQTTKAMKMVSAAKLRRAQDTALQLRPYSRKLNSLLVNLLSSGQAEVSSPFAADRKPEKVLIVVVTSNRGLCGAFNSSILRIAQQRIHELYEGQLAAGNLLIYCIGRKGYEYFKKRKYPLYGENHDLFSGLSFAKVAAAAQEIQQGFLDGAWDRVDLIYNEFKNAMSQEKRADQYLPIALDLPTEGEAAGPTTDYILEPDATSIVTDLIPRLLNTRIYQAVLESNASEHGARMVAMDNATENAQDLIDSLKLKFNKARQAAITKEILEIVGGAEALKG